MFPDHYTTSGLFDLQVNGFAGVDFNDVAITPEAFDKACAAMLATGVTHFLPTLITAPLPVMAARLLALDNAIAQSRLGALMVPGYHLEGPFLNPSPGTAGCHPKEAMILPNSAALSPLLQQRHKPVLLMTLAPELAGAPALIKNLAAQGLTLAIGHSACLHEDVQAACDHGAVLSTHLGNACPHQIHKFNNPLFAQLAEPRLMASFIADGIHVPPFALRVMLAAKGQGKAILVTDAVSAAASPPGLYRFAGQIIERDDTGRVHQQGLPETLAGSSLTLDTAVKNLITWELASRDEAFAMASDNPCALMARSLAYFAITLPPTQVLWTSAGAACRVVIGDETVLE